MSVLAKLGEQSIKTILVQLFQKTNLIQFENVLFPPPPPDLFY